jgi:phosphoenolpyruvate carboxylase
LLREADFWIVGPAQHRHRFYIAPLNYLRSNSAVAGDKGAQDERMRRGILISINGIAAGSRYTG